MTDDVSQSCIKTKCIIDKKEVLKWVLSRFPELNCDARLDAMQDNFNGSCTFTVEHTIQPPKPVGPILLSVTIEDVADAEFEA